jgi:hypothetical protein
MIQKLPYTCRFCGTPHVASYDDECPGMDLDKFMQLLLCCNKCANYRRQRLSIMEGIATACRTAQVATAYGRRMTSEVESRVREKLEVLTKRYASIQCEHLGLTNVWDADFPQQLIDAPDKWGTILRLYDDGLKRLKI